MSPRIWIRFFQCSRPTCRELADTFRKNLFVALSSLSLSLSFLHSTLFKPFLDSLSHSLSSHSLHLLLQLLQYAHFFRSRFPPRRRRIRRCSIYQCYSRLRSHLLDLHHLLLSRKFPLRSSTATPSSSSLRPFVEKVTSENVV